jgi:phosphoribosylformylglycinamidine synthase
MAACAVDEAYRAHIAMGGDPEHVSALDNFCWPDPVESEKTPDGRYKLAQLVRACEGLKDSCLAYGIPLISGKDSMKNDAVINGKKVSVRPTLLVSLMGISRDIRKTVSTDFKKPDDLIFVAGTSTADLGGSFLERILDKKLGKSPCPDTTEAKKLYTALHKAIQKGLLASCHDISDGGMAAALTESAIAGGFGFEADINELIKKQKLTAIEALFTESPSRFVLSIKPEKLAAFTKTMKGLPLFKIGKVRADEIISINCTDKKLIQTDIKTSRESWNILNRNGA